eukprot:11171304-Lingulodinium_polyedra.AAC.1
MPGAKHRRPAAGAGEPARLATYLNESEHSPRRLAGPRRLRSATPSKTRRTPGDTCQRCVTPRTHARPWDLARAPPSQL